MTVPATLVNEPSISDIACRVYYAQKFLEYGDTAFFILRRKFRQLTFLHLYHHVSITLVVRVHVLAQPCTCLPAAGFSRNPPCPSQTTAFLRYDVNGDTYLPALCNSAVHVLMYSHYMLAALDVDTFWKASLTGLQLVQFLTVMAQSVISLYRGPTCGFPDWLKLVMVAYQLTMLALFGAFFVHNYMAREAKRKSKQKAT